MTEVFAQLGQVSKGHARRVLGVRKAAGGDTCGGAPQALVGSRARTSAALAAQRHEGWDAPPGEQYMWHRKASCLTEVRWPGLTFLANVREKKTNISLMELRWK